MSFTTKYNTTINFYSPQLETLDSQLNEENLQKHISEGSIEAFLQQMRKVVDNFEPALQDLQESLTQLDRRLFWKQKAAESITNTDYRGNADRKTTLTAEITQLNETRAHLQGLSDRMHSTADKVDSTVASFVRL